MTTPTPGAGRRENRTLDQITLISRVLEGDEPAPKVIVHDYTISGEAGSETATLSYSIPLPLGMTFAQEQAEKAMPLYDGTVWKITLQTYKAARLAESILSNSDERHADELAEARAETGRLREDLRLRTRDFDDLGTINAGLNNQLARAVDDLRAAKARIAELEANRPDGTTRPTSG
jgi:hypothetical protein